MAEPRVPQITASYSGYVPPFDAAPVVRRMLESVPEKYLVGLSEVVLTNASARSRKFRRMTTLSRGKKVKTSSARGLYHAAWNGKSAWIEIFVDNTLRGWDKGWLLRQFVREGRIGDVLFHEIGHHIHYTVRPEFREKEDVADIWKVRLERLYHRRRYRWLSPLFRLIYAIFGPLINRLSARVGARMVADGSISRAEYEESTRPKQSRPVQ